MAPEQSQTMLTIAPLLTYPYRHEDPHFPTSHTLAIPAQCRSHHQHHSLPPLRRKPSAEDLHAMFYSQRVSDSKRRLMANPNAFDQSWRRRPLSVQCDIRDEARSVVDEAQSGKRSKTYDAAASQLPFAQSSFDFRAQSVVSEKRGPETENVAPRSPENESLMPRSPVSEIAPENESNPRIGNGPEIENLTPEERPQITKENSALLHFVRDLRNCLDDDEGHEAMQDDEGAEFPSRTTSDTIRNDSVIQTNFSRRKRRHTFHVPRRGRQQNLLTLRAAIQRMSRERTMDCAELSLRSEMQHQQQHLSKHKRERAAMAYRRMATVLNQNRQHLIEYKRQKEGLRDLPASVRNRMERMGDVDKEMAMVVDDGMAIGVG